MARGSVMKQRQVVNAPHPRGWIDTRDQSREDQAAYFQAGGNPRGPEEPDASGTAFEGLRPPKRFQATEASSALLEKLADTRGDITHLLPAGVGRRIANDAIREWRLDQSTRDDWLEVTERALMLACQERDNEEAAKDYPFEGASDLQYPILTTAALQFQARAVPELVRGDKAVGIKTFEMPATPLPPPSVLMGHNGGPAGPLPGDAPTPVGAAPGEPQLPPGAQAQPSPEQAAQLQQQAAALQKAQAELAAMQQKFEEDTYKAKLREVRAKRVALYMNWVIFYQMEDWEGETDVLVLETSISGVGFKKVYRGATGVCSDYVSATRLTVNNDTRSMNRCPRITQDFDIYPYEIELAQRRGEFLDVRLPPHNSDDPEASRLFIEQHRMEDMDGDGVLEPYIVTVDVETEMLMSIQSAFTARDIIVDTTSNHVVRIERWQPFPAFRFLPDPRGRFYGLGLGKLLDAITDAVDTSINQLMDAGSAEIAGGGFIGGQVRLQGSGQGGVVYFQPGEYKTLATPGVDLREAIWERTVPRPSDVTFKILELLLAAAKDIASVKDVITGETPATAPVGTTMALQNQALTVFTAIFGRLWRGFREEYRLIYECIRRFSDDKDRAKYAELTGGDLDADFAGDGTDLQPIADPRVVTKIAKTARFGALVQLAESPVGMAAGMQQPGPAQEIVKEGLEIMDYDRPERFVAPVPPNPELMSKVQEQAASAALKQAQAQHLLHVERLDDEGAIHDDAKSNLDQAETLKIMGEVHEQTHRLHQEAARVRREGVEPPALPPEGGLNGPGPITPTPQPAPAGEAAGGAGGAG